MARVYVPMFTNNMSGSDELVFASFGMVRRKLGVLRNFWQRIVSYSTVPSFIYLAVGLGNT